MSVIEDSRKLMQDFIAPELRGIAANLDALQKRYEILDHKVDEVDSRTEKRLVEAEQRAEKRLAEAQSHTDKQLVDLASRTEKRFDKIDQRLDKVDQRFDTMQQMADRQHEEIMSAFVCPPWIASLQMQTREFQSVIKELQEKQKMIASSIESTHNESSAA